MPLVPAMCRQNCTQTHPTNNDKLAKLCLDADGKLVRPSAKSPVTSPVPVFGVLYVVVSEAHHDRTRVIAKRISALRPTWAVAFRRHHLSEGN